MGPLAASLRRLLPGVLLALAPVALSSPCNVTLFSDGFESAMAGWTTTRLSGNVAEWRAGDKSENGTPMHHGGARVAWFNASDTRRGERARLERTAGVAVGSRFDAVTLKFWMYHTSDGLSWNDSVQATVSTDGRTWNPVGGEVFRWDSVAGWREESIDVTAFKGSGSLQVGLEGISAWGWDVYVDDVSLVGQVPASTSYRLSGKVTRDGSPVAGVSVSGGGASAVTAADGTYALDVANGTVTVTPSTSGAWFEPTSRTVVVGCSDRSGLDFDYKDGRRLDVTVTADELDAAHGGSDADTGLSLREAVVEANRDPSQTAWIMLPAGTYRLTRSGAGEDGSLTGDLDVAGKVVLTGAGMEQTVVDGNQLDRVLQVLGGASAELRDLTIRNGLSPRGESGGAIHAAGALKLLRTRISDSATGDYSLSVVGQSAGHGGGIYCTGASLVVTDSLLRDNHTGSGADGLGGGNSMCDRAPNNGDPGGHAGNGGAIAAESCTVTIEGTEVSFNDTGDGGMGGRGGSSRAADYCKTYDGASGARGGNGGLGGGLWLRYGSATVRSSTFMFNRVGGGGEGGFGGRGEGSHGGGADGDGGDAGSGGGLANVAGVVVVSDSVFRANRGIYEDMRGAQGRSGASNGRPVIGGGLYNTASSETVHLTVDRCAIYDNEAYLGGGVGNDDAKMELRNSTIANNRAQRGPGIYDHPFNRLNDSIVTFCTISGNTGNTYGAYWLVGSYNGPTMDNTIVAGNEGEQLFGPTNNVGPHNIMQSANPGLGPLRDNGGPTPTMALLDGSPAIDAGDPAFPAGSAQIPTDQRGRGRVMGGRADIGAYERNRPARFVSPSVGFVTTSVPEGQPISLRGQVTSARYKDVTLGVSWGDGTSSSYPLSCHTDPCSFDQGHTYPNNPASTPTLSRHAEVTLSESDFGTTDSVEAVVSVVNVAPSEVRIALARPLVQEGETATLNGSIVDSVSTEAFTVQLTWGDGSPADSLSLPSGVSAFTATHRYLDNGTFTVTARVTDDDGAVGPVQTTTATVSNVAPALSSLKVSPDPVNEGSGATLTGTITDPGTKDTLTLRVEWGDGTTSTQSLAAGTTTFSAAHTYVDDDPTGTPEDPYTIRVTVTDKDSGTTTQTVGVTVKNVAPVVSGLSATPCLEGGTTTLTGTITDPGTRDTFTVKVDWGDGTTSSYPYPAGTTSFSATHQVFDLVPGGKSPSDNVVKVTVTDDDGGSGSAQTTVRVTNVAPTLSGVAFHGDFPWVTSFVEGDTVHLAGSISDPGAAADSYTLKVAWGDGSTTAHALAKGSTSFDVTHGYMDNPSTPGSLYTANVTLTDADGGTATASATVAVYNVVPQPYADSYDGDEDTVLRVPAPGVLANDTDVPADTLHVAVALSDTVSNHGAKVTLKPDGSFTYDPTARTCPLQNLAEGESVDDTFTYFVGDKDTAPGDAGVYGATVTIHVRGHDESGILHVDASATGANDGSSWTNAYRELQDALAVAWGGQTVHVAAGTYTPDVDLSVRPRVHTGDRSASFSVHRGVKLYGGFPPGGASFAERSPASYRTILSGDIGSTGDASDNSAQVVRIVSPAGEAPMSSPTIVDGFTISGASSDAGQGGGMVVSNASPIVANCAFSGNAARYGGGLALLAGGAPKVVSCVFEGNRATSVSLAGRGGALHSEGTSAEISGCVFRSNTATETGGAVNVSGGAPRLLACSFSGNSAGLKGGAVSNLSSAQLEIGNSILWGDLPDELHDNGNRDTTIRFSDVQGCGGSGSAWWADPSVPRTIVDGGGNIDANPKYTAAPLDLHLQAIPLAMSPAIDAGSNALAGTDAADRDANGNRTEPAPLDLDLLPRFVDHPSRPDTGAGTPPIVDMGAYEVQTNPVLTVTRAGTGTGTVASTSPAAAIACGPTCVTTLAPGTPVTLSATADSGTSFLAWVGACTGTGACTFNMPAAGAAWVGALFLQAPMADLAIACTDGVVNVAPGATVTYTITVTNAGPSDVTGATVTDLFPPTLGGVTWTCLASQGSSCTASGSGSIGDTVSLLAHGSLTYTATGTLSPSASAALVNTATVAAPVTAPDANLANNTAVDTDSIGPEADLAISVSNGGSSVTPGAAVVYTVLVSNSGPSDAALAQVTDHLPASLSGVTWTCVPSALASCTAGPVAGDLLDTVTIPAGGTLTYTVTGVLAAGFTGTLSNTASVSPAAGTSDGNLANNVATDADTTAPFADLSVSLDDGVAVAVPGGSVTYTLTARNGSGPSPIPQALVTDVFPATLTCTWTCAGSGGGTCTAGPVAGPVLDLAGLPVGGAATYTAVCRIAPGASGSLVNTASVGIASTGTDPTASNDSATDTDLLRSLDFGHAPDAPLGPPWAYPVTLAEDGARHGVVAGFHLGATVSAEADATPSLSSSGEPDDDGVSFTSPLVTCETATLTVTASAAGLLDAWVDFDVNGSWDAGEQIFAGRPLAAGANALSFAVPCGATVTDRTWARFRFSSAGALGPSGLAADGEVEDYAVSILGLDLGDAPDPAYPTTRAHDGARHAVSNGLRLGATVTAEPDAVLAGDAGDDGVAFTSAIVPGASATLTVTASAPGRLDAWIDFDGSGDWSGPGEQIFVGQPLAAGANSLSFAVPVTARAGLTTWARFRLSTAGSLTPVGFAADGEVEDYQVTTTAVADLYASLSHAGGTVVPGQTVTYTLVAGNRGPSAARNAHVVDVFPAGTACTWSCVASPGASCTPTGSGDVDDTVSLAAGATATYTATCTVAPAARGTLRNSASVDAPSAIDPNGADNAASDEATLAARGDLAITKTDGSATAVPGRTVSYTIVASNAGPSQAAGARVVDAFPGLSRVTWTCVASTGSSCAASGSGALDESVSIAPGGKVAFTGGGLLAATASGTLSNTASVTAPADLADTPGTKQATDSDTVAPESELTVTMTGPATALAGKDVTYAARVKNLGPSDAPAVVLTVALPPGTTLVSQSQTLGPAFTLASTPAQVTDTIATLAAGASAEFILDVHVGSTVAPSTVLTCSARATTSAVDPTPGDANDVARVATTVSAVLPPEISKAFVPSSIPFLGGRSRLTLAVASPPDNTDTLSGVSFTDLLPSGLVVADPANLASTCGGLATAVAGSRAVSLAGGALVASASCSVSVDVAVDVSVARVGDAVNSVTVSATSTGPGNTAQATLALTAVTSFSGITATSSGTATVRFTGGGPGCTFSRAAWVGLESVPEPPPSGAAFPHGLVDFATTGCTPGGTLEVTLSLPQPLPAGTRYWKYGPTSDRTTAHWYELPADIAGATITFRIQDGGLGDDDLAMNGKVVDQGGPSFEDGGVGIPAFGWPGLLALGLLTAAASLRFLARLEG